MGWWDRSAGPATAHSTRRLFVPLDCARAQVRGGGHRERASHGLHYLIRLRGCQGSTAAVGPGSGRLRGPVPARRGDYGPMSVRVTIQYFDGCPSWQTAQQRLISAAGQAGIDVDLDLQRVETLEDAQRLGFVGSPTILIDEGDPFAQPGAPAELGSRIYRTPTGSDGAPAAEELAAALERAERSSPLPLDPATEAQAGGIGTRTLSLI